MKYSHNKKRNTALIYEMLVREITRAMMNENKSKQADITRMFKKYFNKSTILAEEYAIYKSLNDSRDLNPNVFAKILVEAKRQYSNIDKKAVFVEQTKLISEINKLIGHQFWKNFVGDYQWTATVQQTIAQDNPPKKQIMLEAKMMEIFPVSQQGKKFPKVNNLAISTFIKRFNDTYEGTLTESQSLLINKYILSAADEGLEFRACLYEEIENTKSDLLATAEKIKNKKLVGRIHDVVYKLESYKEKRINESTLLEVLNVQKLVKELKS